jgi:hypothetical protein
VLTRRNYTVLAAVTAVLFVAAASIGAHNDVLWIVDDITFFGFLGCALLLVVMTIAILVRAATRKKTTV